MDSRHTTLEQIALQDEIRTCNHAVEIAFKELEFTKRQNKEVKLKEKNQRRKLRREENKSPIVATITKFLKTKAQKNKEYVLTLHEVCEICKQHNCCSSACVYIRSMLAAAAGAGHFLKHSHTVSFSPLDQTISLKAVA